MKNSQRNFFIGLSIAVLLLLGRSLYVHFTFKSVTPISPTISTTTPIQNTVSSTTPVSKPKPVSVSAPYPTPTSTPNTSILKWGAYVGDGNNNLASLESMVGAKANIQADFEGWDTPFPAYFASTVGQRGKTLVVYWEPNFGYDKINDGSQNNYIKQFAVGAKEYGYPVMLAPFDEFDLNESAWGYGINGNTPTKFLNAWKRVHDIFAKVGANNVKFVLTYNNVSVPNTPDNKFSAYYPGSKYVDYVGVDGFNFGNPWTSFAQTFDSAIATLNTFNKPIYIMSVGTVPGTQKPAWINEMGTHIKTYSKVVGWVWFNSNNQDNGASFVIYSDTPSLESFRGLLNKD